MKNPEKKRTLIFEVRLQKLRRKKKYRMKKGRVKKEKGNFRPSAKVRPKAKPDKTSGGRRRGTGTSRLSKKY